jgi:hypothetical protein
VLPKSSCRACARITGELERKLLRGSLWPVRVVRRLKSRRPEDAPKRFPLTIVRGGVVETVNLPASEYPVLLHIPVLAQAAAMSGKPYSKGVELIGVNLISFGPRPDEVGRRLGATTVRHTTDHQPVEFARTLAKIGYAYAVACLGLDAFEEVFVRDTILGAADDAGLWVGTRQSVAPKHPDLHHLGLDYFPEGKLVVAMVHLLSDSDTPSYDVVVGRLHEHPPGLDPQQARETRPAFGSESGQKMDGHFDISLTVSPPKRAL